MPLQPDAAELRASPAIIARLRRAKIPGRMIMADGWIVDGPDTEANCRVFPKNPSVADGLGFALIRCVGLYCMVNGLLIDLATAAYCGKGGSVRNFVCEGDLTATLSPFPQMMSQTHGRETSRTS